VKFDPNGALLWQRTWGGTLGETALGVATSGDGASVYIIGQTLSFGAGNIDAFLVKFDASGNLVWQRTLGRSNQRDGTGRGSGRRRERLCRGRRQQFLRQ
jgi:outer membrane protein assembly factor BamB